MGKLKLKGKDLRNIGYPEGPVISIAMNIMEKNYKHQKMEEAMELLKRILGSPVEYENDVVLGLIAQQLIPKAQQHLVDTVGLFYPKIVKMDGTPPRQWRNKGEGE